MGKLTRLSLATLKAFVESFGIFERVFHQLITLHEVRLSDSLTSLYACMGRVQVYITVSEEALEENPHVLPTFRVVSVIMAVKTRIYTPQGYKDTKDRMYIYTHFSNYKHGFSFYRLT